MKSFQLGATPIECDKIMDRMKDEEMVTPARPSEFVLFFNNLLRELRSPAPELTLAEKGELDQQVKDRLEQHKLNRRDYETRKELVEQGPPPPPSEENPDGQEYAF